MPPKGSKAVAKKPRVGKTAAPASKTTFLDALMVPELAQACGLAIEGKHNLPRGAGIKTLRLLSQGVRSTLQKAGAIQGYTLKLADKAQPEDPKLVAFLRECRLLHLRITTPGSASSTKAATAKLTAQLSTFITSVSPALSSVTHLTLTLPAASGYDEKETAAAKAATALFLPLAAACPPLQHLTITGRVGASLLQHFGSSSPRLNTLHAVLTNLSPATLHKLSALLPHLTSLAALAPSPVAVPQSTEDKKAAAIKEQAAVSSVLANCPTRLVSLDTGSVEITEGNWKALPDSLHSLSCAVPAYIPEDEWQKRARLHRLVINTSIGFTICPLVELLALCPNVSACRLHGLSKLDVTFTKEDARYLQALDARIDEGLSLSPLPSLRFSFPSWPRASYASDPASELYEHDMAVFFATHMTEPLYHFTEVDFDNEEKDEHTTGDFTDIARVFPNIQQLTAHSVHLAPNAGPALVGCAALWTLTLNTVDGFAGKGLRTLCSKNKALRNVELYCCRGITVKEQEKIQVKGKLGKVGVTIERGCVLEDEDEKRHRWDNYSDEYDRGRGRGSDGSGSGEDDDSDDDRGGGRYRTQDRDYGW